MPKTAKRTAVVGRRYVHSHGQMCLELVRLRRGLYILARNGQIRDARKKLTTEQAAEHLDGMQIRSGFGADEDTGTVDVHDDGRLSVRWDSLVVTPFSAKEIDDLRAI